MASVRKKQWESGGKKIEKREETSPYRKRMIRSRGLVRNNDRGEKRWKKGEREKEREKRKRERERDRERGERAERVRQR